MVINRADYMTRKLKRKKKKKSSLWGQSAISKNRRQVPDIFLNIKEGWCNLS